MKNKSKKLYSYKFKVDEEIESCANCPAGEECPDDVNFYCKIVKFYFSLEDDDNFPSFCPMEETDLPEDFGHR